jgi:uncharacterized protein (TIGR02145 family)
MKKNVFLLSLVICFLTSHGQQTGVFTDLRDGKIYKIIKIGNQTWMADNLAYKASSGCWARSNSQLIVFGKVHNLGIEKYVASYGYLYDWETAKKICPLGWHLPSNEEWEILINFLGGKDVAGVKLKSTLGWSEYGNGTNISGFNALPVGCYYYGDNEFSKMGDDAAFWASSTRTIIP